MHSLRQGRTFLNKEKKLNDEINVKNKPYLAENKEKRTQDFKNVIEPFDVSESNVVYYTNEGSGMWGGELGNEYTCPGANGRDIVGNSGDFNNYCIFRNEDDAKNYCSVDPKCLGYVKGINANQPMFEITAKPVANSVANGVYYKKNVKEMDTVTGTFTMSDVQTLSETFDSKMIAYSKAMEEYSKEILKGNNYFVVQVRTLTPINSCFNCDSTLGGTDCSAMGVSDTNGDIRTALPTSTSPTANLPPCSVAGIVVPGWSANLNSSSGTPGTCLAPISGQKCCPTTMLNSQPVCYADFNGYNFGDMVSWMNQCISPPSQDDVNQKIALATEYCQGNGIDLNYWSKNVNNFVLVTTEDPANGIRPFAKMNNIPVWIVNTFTNEQDANNARMSTVFSPTVQSTVQSTRDDMMKAGNILIKALSSQKTTSSEERQKIEEQLRSVEMKMSSLASQSSNGDMDVKEPFSTTASSLLAMEKDERMQFDSNYAFYTVFVIMAIILIVIVFSNFFMSGKSESGSDTSSSSSGVLLFGVIALLFFIYFIVQFVLIYFNINQLNLPLKSVNPLFLFKS